MPITKTKGYLDSTGVMHATVEGAQFAEMRALFAVLNGSGSVDDKVIKDIVADLLQPNHVARLLSILTTGPRSRPKARKAAGTTSPKRALRAGRARTAEEKAHVEDVTGQPFRATPEQASNGFAAMREAATA